MSESTDPSSSSSSASATSTDPNTTSNVVEMPQADSQTSATRDQNTTGQRAQTAPPETGGSSKAALVLGVLLAGSLGLNFIQSQTRSNLEAQSAQYSTALERSIVRLDEETFRANGAEDKLEAIDGSVGVVNERITELQKALTDLSEITAR